MSLKQMDDLREHIREAQEENDKKAFFPFMSQREMCEALMPDRVGEKEYMAKMMKGGLGDVMGRYNPLNDPFWNTPKGSSDN